MILNSGKSNNKDISDFKLFSKTRIGYVMKNKSILKQRYKSRKHPLCGFKENNHEKNRNEPD